MGRLLVTALAWATLLSVSAASTVSDCDPMILGPNPVFVPYGGSISLNCTTMCNSTIESKGWETSLKKERETPDTYWIWTKLVNITEWVSSPNCFIIASSEPRITRTTIVAFQSPDKVHINLPLEMVVGQLYNLTCLAVNIAPKRNITVFVHRGKETLLTETFTGDTTIISTNVTVTHTVRAQRDHHGADYSCLAQLDLRPNGGIFEASSPRVSISVVGPPININISAEKTDFKKGDNFTVKCHAEGNPPPTFSWRLPFNDSTRILSDGSTVAIFSAQSAHGGTYTCTAFNSYGDISSKVDILFKETSFPSWVIALIVIVCLLSVAVAALVFRRFRK